MEYELADNNAQRSDANMFDNYYRQLDAIPDGDNYQDQDSPD
jgi:hypothetical protein